MYLLDSHVHTLFSPDASGTVEEHCVKALENGFSEIIITDHCDVNGWEGRPYDFRRGEAFSEIEAAREKFEGRLRIGFGAELGQEQENLYLAAETLVDARLDFVIGSLHNPAGYMDCFFFADAAGDMTWLWLKYLEELVLHAEKSDYDVIGHLTYPLRYIPVKWCAEYDDALAEVMKTAISRGKGIELNMSDFLRKNGYTHPHAEHIKLYRDLGGKYITVGSDSHFPQTVGQSIKDGYDILKAAGFDRVCAYRNRQPEFVRI